MKTILLSSFLLVMADSSQAQQVPAFPVGAEKFFNTVMKGINARHVKWIKKTAEKVNETKMTEEQVKTEAIGYAVLGNISNADIDALCFLVLMEAAKSAQEDLKAIMAHIKAINDAKAKQRQALQKAQQNQSMTILQLDSLKWINSRNNLLLAGDNPETVKFKRTRSVVAKPTKADIDAVVDTMKSDLDAMSKMGETESLRLQMAMDRLTKMMSTISNLLKKISDTEQSIIQNLK